MRDAQTAVPTTHLVYMTKPGAFGAMSQSHRGEWRRVDSHLSRIYACNPFAIPISSSQLIARYVATARLCVVRGSVAAALLLVQVCEIGDGMRGVGSGLGRRGHSKGVERKLPRALAEGIWISERDGGGESAVRGSRRLVL